MDPLLVVPFASLACALAVLGLKLDGKVVATWGRVLAAEGVILAVGVLSALLAAEAVQRM